MGRLADIRQEHAVIADRIRELKEEYHRLALEGEEWDDEIRHWLCCGTKYRPGSAMQQNVGYVMKEVPGAW